jgi:predicted nucleic acid-binding protein
VRTVVIDASALAALVFKEPSAEAVAERIDGAALAAPELLRYELANVAWKKLRRAPDNQRAAIMIALDRALDARRGLRFYAVNPTDVVVIARAAGVSTYDASYLWLAGMLGADLVTLDGPFGRVGDDV